MKNAIKDAIRRGWLKNFIDKDGCKEDRPLRKKRSDDDSDDEEMQKERKRPKTVENAQNNRADRDKNCPGIIHTIVGGPPTQSRSNSDSISGSSKGKGKMVCHVEPKRLKVDNTITFTDEDFDGIETPHQDALVKIGRAHV